MWTFLTSNSNFVWDSLRDFAGSTGIAALFESMGWGNVAMICVAFFLLYLAIKHKFEPLLLLTIAFGMLLANLPLSALCIKLTGWAPAAFAVRVSMTAIIYLFITYMMRLQIGLGFWHYLYQSLLRPLPIFAVAAGAAFLMHSATGPGVLNAVGNALLFWAVMGAGIYIFGLSAEERHKVRSQLRARLLTIQHPQRP